MGLIEIISNNFLTLQTNEILNLNKNIKEYNLYISEKEAKDIMITRKKVLSDYGFIDFENNVPKDLILEFSSSYYINQDNFIEVISNLIDVFYFIKDKSNDSISDEELISKMKELFNTECGGDTDYLKDKLYIMIENLIDEGFIR